MFPVAWCVTAFAADFPATWQALPAAGGVLTDPVGDDLATGPLDVVGDTTVAALAWWADRDHVYLRLRVAEDPAAAAGAWTFLVDVDGQPDDFELAVQVLGPSGAPGIGLVGLATNAAGTDGSWVADLEWTGLSADTALLEASARYWVQVAVPRASLGVGPTTPIRIAATTAESWPLGPVDAAGCTGSGCTALAKLSSDPVTIDRDEDGLADPEEDAAGTDPDDDDTDDDGVLDGDEGGDLDADGTVDALECDRDEDGLSDGTELGITDEPEGTDKKGCFIPDDHPKSTTDPSLADTDGGGLGDGREDADRDGRVDAWEADPRRAADDADADLDGIPDDLDDAFGVGADDDSDGDGLLDVDERLGDFDGDGLPDFGDPDADDDGRGDAAEGADDQDHDGWPNFADLDADDDGLLDADELDGDSDADGLPGWLDRDSDDDGLDDGEEGAGDADGDGILDRDAPDADGDGLLDADEGIDDTDGDGVPDRLDLDSDEDTWSDAVEGGEDTDGDLLADFRDPDSDGDGLADRYELDADSDCDGLADRLDDEDEDGWCDELQPLDVSDASPTAEPLAPPECGCSAAAGGAPWGSAALAGLLWRRARRRGAAARRGGDGRSGSLRRGGRDRRAG